MHPVRTLLATLAVLAAACGKPGPPNIVVVTVESLRTDHVGVYGGRSRSRPDVPVTPNLDAFAREAVVYDDAQAPTSWTLASHASIFTGLYPTAHQTIRPRDRLDDSYTTFAEVLRDRGYQTVGIVSGPYLRTAHNLNQGFELYHDDIAAPSAAESHDDVTKPRSTASSPPSAIRSGRSSCSSTSGIRTTTTCRRRRGTRRSSDPTASRSTCGSSRAARTSRRACRRRG